MAPRGAVVRIDRTETEIRKQPPLPGIFPLLLPEQLLWVNMKSYRIVFHVDLVLTDGCRQDTCSSKCEPLDCYKQAH